MSSPRPSCVLPLALLASFVAFPAKAYWRTDSGGTACHPANGAAAARFTRNNFTLTNNATNDQYVVCSFTGDDVFDNTRQVSRMYVHFTAGTTGGTVACTVQIGQHFYGTTTLRVSDARSYAVSANSPGWIEWQAAGWQRDWIDTVTVNCRVPPGFRIGLLELWEYDQLN